MYRYVLNFTSNPYFTYLSEMCKRNVLFCKNNGRLTGRAVVKIIGFFCQLLLLLSAWISWYNPCSGRNETNQLSAKFPFYRSMYILAGRCRLLWHIASRFSRLVGCVWSKYVLGRGEFIIVWVITNFFVSNSWYSDPPYRKFWIFVVCASV